MVQTEPAESHHARGDSGNGDVRPNVRPGENWPDLLTVAEVAEILRVSRMTVYRLAQDGNIRSLRVGRSFRIPADQVSRLIEAPTGDADSPADRDEDAPDRRQREGA